VEVTDEAAGRLRDAIRSASDGLVEREARTRLGLFWHRAMSAPRAAQVNLNVRACEQSGPETC